jgi:hypothetical protein
LRELAARTIVKAIVTKIGAVGDPDISAAIVTQRLDAIGTDVGTTRIYPVGNAIVGSSLVAAGFDAIDDTSVPPIVGLLSLHSIGNASRRLTIVAACLDAIGRALARNLSRYTALDALLAGFSPLARLGHGDALFGRGFPLDARGRSVWPSLRPHFGTALRPFGCGATLRPLSGSAAGCALGGTGVTAALGLGSFLSPIGALSICRGAN